MKEVWGGIIAMVVIAVITAIVLGATDSTTAQMFSTSNVRL